MIATLLITGATTIEQVWALRALQAVGGGASSVVCMAQVRDIYPPSEVGNKIANVMMVMLVAPLIAPLLGALLMPWGWKSIFYFLALYASVYFTIYCFYIPETNADERRRVTFRSMTASYKAVLAHRVDGRRKAQRLMCFSACSAGIFMSYLTNAAFIYMQHFGLNEFEFSAAFATAGLAMMVGNRSAAKLMSVYSPAKVLLWANGCHIVAIAAAVVWLVLFGSNLWATMLIMMVIVAISGAVGPSAAGLYISLFHENVGSAASLNSTFMFMFGALFGALSALVAGGSLTPIFLAMLVAAILARIALPREV
jgi:DHA1 family bicyclomycin/chloramphenicol resistance-like MFS transporter